MRLLSLLILFSIALNSLAQNTQTEHRLTTSATVEISVDYPYLLYLPESKENTQDGKWPLLIFLHGAGERGEDFELLKKHGPPMLIASGEDFPFITLTPQCPLEERWDPFALSVLIDEIIKNYPVDPSRIYLTGLSMGGYGTWDLAILYPQKFAAIAPICGGDLKNAKEAVDHILDLPIWAFHGAQDKVVPIENTTRIINALQGQGSDAKFTVYPLAGHDSWTETYANPELYRWFLSHKTNKL